MISTAPRQRRGALGRRWVLLLPVILAPTLAISLLCVFVNSSSYKAFVEQIRMHTGHERDLRLPFVDLLVDGGHGTVTPQLLYEGVHPFWSYRQPVVRQKLVMTMAFYGPEDIHSQLKYLIRSFKQTVNNGTLVIFLTTPPPLAALPDHDPDSILLVRIPQPPIANPYILRWFIYHSFLTALGALPAVCAPGATNATAPVLTVDARDTVIQQDPFDGALMPLHGDSLSFFSESGKYTIMDEKYNRGWIEACYGAEGATRVGGMRVVNSGTNWGPRGLLLTYFEAMKAEYQRLVATSAGGDCLQLQGVDQGIHQYMLYSGGLAGRVPFRLEANEVGVVLTGHASDGTFTSGGCMVRNVMGRPFVVLHQWDRVAALKALVEACYPGREVAADGEGAAAAGAGQVKAEAGTPPR